MNSYQFFLKHAGYSYDPKTQTPMQGRIQCARRLAAAERKARDSGISFEWGTDGQTSAEWTANNGDGNCNPWSTWYCTALTMEQESRELASLCGIDFGRDGEPWGDPYRRVVEAELALEALDNLEVAK